MSSAIFKMQTCWAALLKLILICDATCTLGAISIIYLSTFNFQLSSHLFLPFLVCLVHPVISKTLLVLGITEQPYISDEKMSIPEITWLKCHSIMKYIKIFLLQWPRLASLQLRNSIISSLSKVRPRKHYPMKSHQMWYGLFVIAQYHKSQLKLRIYYYILWFGYQHLLYIVITTILLCKGKPTSRYMDISWPFPYRSNASKNMDQPIVWDQNYKAACKCISI